MESDYKHCQRNLELKKIMLEKLEMILHQMDEMICLCIIRQILKVSHGITLSIKIHLVRQPRLKNT